MANLDCGEEVHRSRILGEWSNMTSYKMFVPKDEAYTTAMTSPVENFKHGWKYDMGVNLATLFTKGILWRSSFLGNFKPLDKKLSL